MSNHPNRSRSLTGWRNPATDEIRAARHAAGLTQTEAGSLIYSPLRTWQDWEAGMYRMHPGLWELFCVKTGAKDLAINPKKQ